MAKWNKKLILAIGAAVITASLGTTVAYANSAYSQANAKINHLETSFEKNYLGNTNLPTFRKYLSDAKSLTSKVTSSSDKQKLQERINQCEVVIVTTEHLVNMENSMERNYRGMKNVPAFQAYLDKVNNSLAGVKNKIVHTKLSDRSYAGMNVIRDIKVSDSENYVKASKLRLEAIDSINSGSISDGKTKASEALSYVWKCDTSLAKDAIAGELKAIGSM